MGSLETQSVELRKNMGVVPSHFVINIDKARTFYICAFAEKMEGNKNECVLRRQDRYHSDWVE